MTWLSFKLGLNFFDANDKKERNCQTEYYTKKEFHCFFKDKELILGKSQMH